MHRRKILLVQTLRHISISFISGGEQMRWHFIATFSDEHFHHGFGVDRQPFVWIDDDTEQARIGLKIHK